VSEGNSNVSWLKHDRAGAQPAPGFAVTKDDLAFLEALGVRARQYWKLLLGILALSLAAGVAASLLMPESYRAMARMEVSQQAALASDPANVSMDDVERQRVYLQTQYELMRTPSLAESVTEALDLQSDPAFLAAHGLGENTEEDIASVLIEGIVVEPVADSALVDIGFVSPDPLVAMNVANGWVEQFVIASRERRTRSMTGERANLENRVAALRAEIEEAEMELIAYAADRGLLGNEAEATSIADRTIGQQLVLAELEQANADLASATAARIAAQSALAAGTGAARERTSTNVAALRQRRTELEGEVAELSSRFGDAYPPLVGLRDEIAAIDEQVDDAEIATSESLDADFRAAQARENLLRSRVDDLREQVVIQREDSLQYNILEREVEERRTLYDALLSRLREMSLVEVGADPVSLVEPARVPLEPYSPNWLFNLAVAFGLGLLIAAGALVFLALRPIRS